MPNRRGGKNKGRNNSMVRIRNTAKHTHKFIIRPVEGADYYNYESVCRDCNYVADRFHQGVATVQPKIQEG